MSCKLKYIFPKASIGLRNEFVAEAHLAKRATEHREATYSHVCGVP
jgi:hypothetical protein